MTEPYIGEIQLFGFDYNPYGWAFCNGATLPITQNTTLYSCSAWPMAATVAAPSSYRTFRARRLPAGRGAGPDPALAG